MKIKKKKKQWNFKSNNRDEYEKQSIIKKRMKTK